MIEINLIPDVKQELIRAQTQRSFVIFISIVSAIAAVGLVVLILIYVYGAQAIRDSYLEGRIKDESTKLASNDELSKVLTIQNQLSKIGELNDKKKIDSRLFDVLAAVIPPAPNNVTINNLSLVAEGTTLTMEGQAPTYTALETFKKTLDGALIVYRQNDSEQEVPLASNISTSDVSYGEDSTGTRVLRFTMSFTYAEPLFSPSTSSFLVRLSNEGNVTDSYLGIPKNIFAPAATNTETN